jgi:transposase
MTRRKRYSAEFKREALRRANEEGVTDTLVAEELGFSTRQLRRWRDEAKKHGDEAFPGQGNAQARQNRTGAGFFKGSGGAFNRSMQHSVFW